MSQFDQTRDNFLEALLEIMDKFFEELRDLQNKKEKEQKGEGNELSDNAKDLLKTLKKDPELTKNLIEQYALEKIDNNTDKLKIVNDRILDKLEEMKQGIDQSTPEGKERYEKIERLEKFQLDKESNIKDKIYKLLVLASENSNDPESKTALLRAEKLLEKYNLNKDDILENSNEQKQEEREPIKYINERTTINENSETLVNEKEKDEKNIDIIVEQKDFSQESIYVENEEVKKDNTKDWILENRMNVISVENSYELKTSQKLEYLEKVGVDTRRMHSKLTVDKAFDQQMQLEKDQFDNENKTVNSKEVKSEKEEVTLER